MAGDADPTTDTDRELLDAARVSELQTEERDLGESSRGPAVRKESG